MLSRNTACIATNMRILLYILSRAELSQGKGKIGSHSHTNTHDVKEGADALNVTRNVDGRAGSKIHDDMSIGLVDSY